MREIKFRAWDGAKLWYPETWAGSDEYVAAHKDEDYDTDMGLLFNALDNLHRQTTVILMQYTGLKDKSGLKIYEGDIVGLEGIPLSNSPVSFSAGAFVLSNPEVSSEPNLGDMLRTPVWSALEVIGNIYETSDLLAKAVI
ncbi:conserved hypothetical protein [Arthrobacter sp. Hiyo8]|uniref:YopX family protein n=1 Tax=Arthrobacter sp. Hiyo1 TaxID=1588020 RepID=UPI0006839E0D|nr:YopX family protein [Arthrobacter sp. Hiyo1]BAS17605.1 conserved hypothetical protein [Arthrobacter sp. Hiyo8]GAP57963.1 conserved hypothetical protein [Arthrobacter sp. Hiyo1]